MIKKITKTVYQCRCEWNDCQHEWESHEVPDRCAKCKRRTWNGTDQRTQDGEANFVSPQFTTPAKKAAKLPKPRRVRSAE